MSFTVNAENLSIMGRAGESLDITFNFQDEIQDKCVDFVILEKMGAKPLIKKSFKNPDSNSVKFTLTSEELRPFAPDSDAPKNYHWGLVVHIGKTFSTIVIPKCLDEAPRFVIYPGIADCEQRAESVSGEDGAGPFSASNQAADCEENTESEENNG